MNWLALDAIARNGDGLDGRLRELLELRASRALNPRIVELDDWRSRAEADLACGDRTPSGRDAPAEPPGSSGSVAAIPTLRQRRPA